MPVEIAVLADDRIDAAVALWTAAGLVRPWNDPHADARRALAGPAATIFGAVSSDALVGTVMTGHDGHRGWVYYLAVSADHRRQGIAGLLLAAAEAWCAARAMPRLNLMVRGGDDAVIGYYERRGYRRSDVVVMQKHLPGD